VIILVTALFIDVTTFHCTPTYIVKRWVCSTSLLTIGTRAAPVCILCTRGRMDPITIVAGFFCGIVTASAAADPGIRIAFHLTFRTGTRISILDASLRIPACMLIGPVAADFRAPSYAAIC